MRGIIRSNDSLHYCSVFIWLFKFLFSFFKFICALFSFDCWVSKRFCFNCVSLTIFLGCNVFALISLFVVFLWLRVMGFEKHTKEDKLFSLMFSFILFLIKFIYTYIEKLLSNNFSLVLPISTNFLCDNIYLFIL